MSTGGQGFEFTPWGILPIGAPRPAVSADGVVGGAVPREEPEAAESKAPAKPLPQRAAALDLKTLTGKAYIDALRARLRELQIRVRARKAEDAEIAQLTALILAAKPARKTTKAH